MAGFATVFVLAPSPALAQDVSFLVVLGVPPFLLAPLVAAVIRRAWLRRASGPAPSGLRLLALGALEFVLWFVATWFAAVVYFQGDWGAALVLGGVVAAILALNRRFATRKRSWLLAVGLASVFPAAWLFLQSLWYGLILLWG